jgi:hypothetical protein
MHQFIPNFLLDYCDLPFTALISIPDNAAPGQEFG